MIQARPNRCNASVSVSAYSFLVSWRAALPSSRNHLEVVVEVELLGALEEYQRAFGLAGALSHKVRNFFDEGGVSWVITGRVSNHLDQVDEAGCFEFAKATSLLQNSGKLRPDWRYLIALAGQHGRVKAAYEHQRVCPERVVRAILVRCDSFKPCFEPARTCVEITLLAREVAVDHCVIERLKEVGEELQIDCMIAVDHQRLEGVVARIQFVVVIEPPNTRSRALRSAPQASACRYHAHHQAESPVGSALPSPDAGAPANEKALPPAALR